MAEASRDAVFANLASALSALDEARGILATMLYAEDELRGAKLAQLCAQAHDLADLGAAMLRAADALTEAA